MTTTRIYRSTDSGAPVLVGGVSSLINLLDKCLVDGYGTKDPAGWTKPYTGTDKAAFRNSVAAGGSGMYLRIDDSGGLTGGARNASCRAYSSMSDVDTGTDETPSVAQAASGSVWRKSATLDATARAWIVIADERTVSVAVDTGTSTYGRGFYGAGDFDSEVPGDAYAWMIHGRAVAAAGLSNGDFAANGTGGTFMCANAWSAPASCSLWVARGYAGGAGAVLHALAIPCYGANTALAMPGAFGLPALSPGGGNVYWVPAIMAAEGTLRGTLRGLHVPLNALSGVTLGTNYSGATGRPSGSVLTVVVHNYDDSASSRVGYFAVESALEW